MVASCVLIFFERGGSGTIKKVSVLLLIYLLASLMVSNFRYYSFKDPELFRRQPFGILVGLILLIIVVVGWPEISLFVLSFSYMISGPLGYLIHLARRDRKAGGGGAPVAGKT